MAQLPVAVEQALAAAQLPVAAEQALVVAQRQVAVVPALVAEQAHSVAVAELVAAALAVDDNRPANSPELPHEIVSQILWNLDNFSSMKA